MTLVQLKSSLRSVPEGSYATCIALPLVFASRCSRLPANGHASLDVPMPRDVQSSLAGVWLPTACLITCYFAVCQVIVQVCSLKQVI